MKLYQLVSELACRRPARWQMQPRYALQLPGRELTLPGGAWLLELPAESASADGVDSEDILYRLADGTLVTLSRPLTDSEAMLVENPQAVWAMATYRSLEQAAFEDWGVQVEHIDHHPPFNSLSARCVGGQISPALTLPRSGAIPVTPPSRCGIALAILAG